MSERTSLIGPNQYRVACSIRRRMDGKWMWTVSLVPEQGKGNIHILARGSTLTYRGALRRGRRLYNDWTETVALANENFVQEVQIRRPVRA